MFNTYPAPLAERMRPQQLSEFVGQEHLVGPEGIIRKMVENKNLQSFILWGPPGVGKTTLAKLVAKAQNKPFVGLSAIQVGVKEIREVIEKAKIYTGTVLFLDEIHRFNKSQQDALLKAVEEGVITLIGATTENPSFEVNSALLSRCRVFTLQALEPASLSLIINRAIEKDEYLSKLNIQILEVEALFRLAGGDARSLLNIFELTVDFLSSSAKDQVVITNDNVLKASQSKTALYDKKGEQHYDIISAFIKSIRGSDPNAAVYYLARMIAGGEDPKFIARRLVVLASEDIGNANPTDMVMASATFQSVNFVGMPESRIILSQLVTYLASSPKSNSSYEAIGMAQELVAQFGDLPVPLHLRNAPTKFMKNEGYGKDYQYTHQFDGNFVDQEFMPEKLSGKLIYNPGKNQREEELRTRLKHLWKAKYGY